MVKLRPTYANISASRGSRTSAHLQHPVESLAPSRLLHIEEGACGGRAPGRAASEEAALVRPRGAWEGESQRRSGTAAPSAVGGTGRGAESHAGGHRVGTGRLGPCSQSGGRGGNPVTGARGGPAGDRQGRVGASGSRHYRAGAERLCRVACSRAGRVPGTPLAFGEAM
jgi:hypothetical protein